MVISHNIPALMTHLNMKKNDRLATTAMQRLSTGLRINSAKDDAAGLAIANKLSYQVSGLEKASSNATHGISMIQTAEGALNEMHSMLQRMRELSIQAATGTLTDEDRDKIQTEINELVDEISALANRTEFNKIKLLNGEANRVTNTFYKSGSTLTENRVIATPLYLTENIPAGTLEYTIEQVGLPAEVVGVPVASGSRVEPAILLNDVASMDASYVAPEDCVLVINGQEIQISKNDNITMIQTKIQNAYADPNSGIIYTNNGSGSFALTTRNPFGNEYIQVEGDWSVISALGLTSTLATASDGSGLMAINGHAIDISATDTYQSVYGKIVEACGYAGINIETIKDSSNKDILLFSSIQAGSSQSIEITGDPNLLKYFGLQPAVSNGTDAVVKATMKDEAGNPVTTFNKGMSILADGNQVTIIGTGRETIKLNIQVRPIATNTTRLISTTASKPTDPANSKRFTANPANYAYGDGKTPVAGTGTPATTTAMQLEVTDYGPIMLQIGPNFNMSMSIQIPKMTSETLGFVEYKGGKMTRLLNCGTQDTAQLAIEKLDAGLAVVSNVRSRLGAYQNRLEQTIRSLDTAAENTETSRSRIQDTDMAKEMTNYTQRNVMYQAGLAILSQANQRPQQVLSLLQ